jgi:hypothetical protein
MQKYAEMEFIIVVFMTLSVWPNGGKKLDIKKEERRGKKFRMHLAYLYLKQHRKDNNG